MAEANILLRDGQTSEHLSDVSESQAPCGQGGFTLRGTEGDFQES